MSEEVNDPFWSNDITVLCREDRLLEFFVSKDQSISEKLNSIVRFGVYTSILLSMYHKEPKFLLLSLILFIITYVIYHGRNDESFETSVKPGKPVEYKEEFTLPTINNPFGNNSVTDIIDNPTKPPMKPYASRTDEALKVKDDIEEKFNYNLYTDVDNLYGKVNSQRQFYTTPNRGNIPNDPDGNFKNWLYGSMPSCKDNTFECGKTNAEDLRAKRQVLPNPLVNPINIEASKNMPKPV